GASAPPSEICAAARNTTPGLVLASKTPASAGPTKRLTPSTMLPATLVAASSCGVRARAARRDHSHGRETDETTVTTPARANTTRGSLPSAAAADAASAAERARYARRRTRSRG